MENEKTDEIDTAAAAREARRRRILENSNKRLGKITGRVHNEEIPQIESEQEIINKIYPDPEFERDTFEARANTVFQSNGMPNKDVFELLKAMQDNKTQTSNQQQQQKPPETAFTKFIQSKIPIVLIALIVYTLHVFNLEKFVGNSVFLLLLLWEIFEFCITAFIIKEPLPQNQIFVLLSMFLGLSPSRIQLIMKVLGLFNKILRDIAIFLFTFVFLHLTYSFCYKGENISEILDKELSSMLGFKNDEL
ncbi:hypothetical protein PVAND_012339 [Polypedilum vanderplanki]|uniref:Uncharacterized protein n=1 Tax=Polypedilum vanderplanki TaxID=319348 RepID=A0A9J6CM41_POLVA|nr:hypothetical protein PVAND_012339 [Polypedilum vanderplanki]